MKQDSDHISHNRKFNNRSYGNDNANYERIVRKRKRKSTDQLKILMREFDRNPNWSKETLLEVSRKTGLSEAQVYKWGWD
jgi:bisphosphoglycerate-dependent phosphoglycerate mutase